MESRALALVLAVCLLAGVGGQGPVSAPAPGPAAPACNADGTSTTRLVGPGQYAVQGTVDALGQTARSVFVCPSGGLFGIDTLHVAASNAPFTGKAASANVNWNAAELTFTCTNYGSPVPSSDPSYINPLPMVNGAWNVRVLDAAANPPRGGFNSGSNRPSSPETIYSVTPTTSLFLHNILPSKVAIPTSPYFIADATYANVTCPQNYKFIGAVWAATYAGIDHLEFVCAPNCYAPSYGAAITVGNYTVNAGVIKTDTLIANPPPAIPAGTCSNANPGSQAHIGPGPAYVALTNVTGTVKQPVTTYLCAGNNYIKRWNLRGQTWPASYTGERLAYIGAQCTDNSWLTPAPTGVLNGTATGPLGPDRYYSAGGSSGTNDANGWNAFPIALDGATTPLGYPKFLAVLDAATNGVASSNPDGQSHLITCPAGQRAVGYTVGAYQNIGIYDLDIVCAPNCTAPAPAPSSTPSTPTTPVASGPGSGGPLAPGGAPGGQAQPTPSSPSTPSTPEKQAYGCGSTVQSNIGPGKFALYNSGLPLPLQQQQYTTAVCPPGAYIGEFRVSVSSFDAPHGDEADTYITGISATCYRRTQNLAHTRLQAIEASRATNETEYVFQNPTTGFSAFEVTPGTQPQLQQFLGVDDTPSTNNILHCDQGFVAIGYIGAAYAFGIDVFDIICGPKLPSDCPDNGQGGGAIPSGSSGGGIATGGTITAPPFSYTTNPNGPSYTEQVTTPRPVTPSGSAAPPPPPNAPGNSIDLSKLTAKQTFLRVTLGVTGSNINPFPQKLQDDYNKTIATVTKVPQRNVTFVSATLNSTSSGRRLLEQLGRSLLQTTETMDVQYSIQFASARALAEAAEQLTESLTPPNTTFATILAHPELSTTMKSLTASDTQASTQAGTSCTRKFGSICVHNSRLSNGGIAGIIIGGVVFLALVAALAFFLLSRRRRAARTNVH